jgi:kynureninase
MAAHLASLEIFVRAGMEALSDKADKLNAYAEFVILEAIKSNPGLDLKVITPPQPERGCQISMLTGAGGRKLFEYLEENGVVADWRNPNVIRMAAVPLYNSFTDVYSFGELLRSFSVSGSLS